MKGLQLEFSGVTFDTLRASLAMMYFGKKSMSQDEWQEALHYVVPMQHNFENPIKATSTDTFIQYWIDDDDRLTQDHNINGGNTTHKICRVTLRFLGQSAESWAKAFHHLTKRQSVANIFVEYCNAHRTEYVSRIMPINVDYFGVGNTVVAYTLTFQLVYNEVLVLAESDILEYVSFQDGDVIIDGGLEE